MNADLQHFVREALSRGQSRDSIREQLDRAGWRSDEIDAALAAWAESEFPVPVPRRRTQLSAREAFLYLVMFVTLYVTAFNVGAILFQLIERWLPDAALARGYAGFDRFNARAVRDSIAGLLIAFPVLLFLSAFIGRMQQRDAEKRSSGVRKWLTYITLFVTALVILGDLTYLVSRLLSGDTPPRFLARTLVVFLIAGYVFGHYLAGLRQEEEDRPGTLRRPDRLMPRLASVAVVAVMAVALFVAGSPRKARVEEIDRHRVRDLQAISQSVESYYDEHRALPVTLDTLFLAPGATLESARDPVTKQLYVYHVTDAKTYELCATFDRPDADEDSNARMTTPDRPLRFWQHESGEKCYRLVIPRRIVEDARP